jgi:hypothetical protein
MLTYDVCLVCPFSVGDCPMVMALRNLSFVSTTLCLNNNKKIKQLKFVYKETYFHLLGFKL